MNATKQEIQNVGMHYIGGAPYTKRMWKAHYKFSISQIERIRNILPNIPTKWLLLWLYYMKTYPTYDMAAAWSNITAKTFRNHIYQTTTQLEAAIPQVGRYYGMYFALTL